MTKQIPLTNSSKTATCDNCCFGYLSQYQWHMTRDGHAARHEPCDEHPDGHLVLMEEEVASRHVCDMEHQAAEDEASTCYECTARVGRAHRAGCPIAICLVTGRPRLDCAAKHDCGYDCWSGELPGDAECREYGLFSDWVDSEGRSIPPHDHVTPGRWVDATADDPYAVADMDRLHELGRWDRKRQRWVLR